MGTAPLAHPEEGLTFAGRVAEEFKLLSGVFVRVGSLRVALIDAAPGSAIGVGGRPLRV